MHTILASLPPGMDFEVYDNSQRTDVACYGRFAAALNATTRYVYTQDDDCLAPVHGLLESYDGTMLVNVPPVEKPLTAWGAIFDRLSVEEAFARYLDVWPEDEFFYRTCDVIHTALTPWERIDLGHADFPWATAPNRMYHEIDHYEVRLEAERRCHNLA